jgi:hypothetical protein
MRTIILPAVALLAIAGGEVAPTQALTQSSPVSGTSTSHASARPSAYLSDTSAFLPGRVVYLRSTRTRIGVIEAADAHHQFPASFSRRSMSAVLIRRKDGPRDWVPLDGITRIYVVQR